MHHPVNPPVLPMLAKREGCLGSDITIDSAEKLVNMICHRRKQTLRIAK